MQHKVIYLLVLSWLLIVLWAPLGASDRFRIQWCIEQQSFCTKPGGILPFGALVVNPSNEKQAGSIRIRCPHGFEAIHLGSQDVVLEPGESSVYLGMLRSEAGCQPGKHSVVIEVVVDNLVVAEDALDITIEEHIGLKVHVADVPPMVMSGQPYEVALSWENIGNVAVPLRVAVNTSPECYYEVEDDNDVACGGGVKVYIAPSENTCETYIQLVNLKIFHCETDELLWEHSALTEVFSQLRYAEPPVLSVPSSLGFFGGHEHGRSIIGTSLVGGGYINTEAERWLEYEFVVPSENYSGVYNQIEILRLAMQEPDWRADVGDGIYGLSPLTEMWRWGRGGQFFKIWDQFEAGALYVSRRSEDCEAPEEYGGYLCWRPFCNFFACYNYLHKNPNECEYSADIHSLQCRYAPCPDCFGEVEVANDCGSSDSKGSKAAYRLALSGQMPDDRGTFWCERIWAGAGFNGYYNGTDMTTFNMEGPLLGQLRGGLAGTWYKQDIGPLDNYLSVLPDNRYFQAELGYAWSESIQSTLVGRSLRLRDRQYDCSYNLEQEWLDARWSYIGSGLLLTAGASMGRQNDVLTRQVTFPLQAYNFYGCWAQTPVFEWNLQLDTGNIQYYDADKWRTAVQGGCRYVISPNTWFLCHANMAMNMPELCLFSHASATLGHTFANGHRIYCNAQYYDCERAAEPHEWLAYVSYEIPFDLVIPQEIQTGSVCGMVFDAETSQPIQGAVVSLSGQRTFTDESGVYRYPAVCPGCYELCIQLLPDHYTTCYENSCGVHVDKGQKTEQHIPLVRAGRLEGRLTLYDVQKTLNASERYYLLGRLSESDFWSCLESNGGFAHARLTLVRDGCQTKVRTSTDADGQFRFERLRPGRWTLFVETKDIPSTHEIIDSVRCFTLHVGEEGYIEIDVVPKRVEDSITMKYSLLQGEGDRNRAFSRRRSRHISAQRVSQ